jgi:hypothetical protein
LPNGKREGVIAGISLYCNLKNIVMETLPIYIALVFVIITALTVLFFYAASRRSKTVLIILVALLVINGIVAVTGFYTVTDTMPPRFVLVLGPPLLLIAVLFISRKGRQFIDDLDLRLLTALHTIRIPVEIVLFLLCIHKTIPGVMTFEGRNFDILSGISAAVIYFVMFHKGKYNNRILLAWNFICLGLLVNIVAIAILSAPFVFQQMAFDQPNIAVLHFPFVWLPAVVVPLVLFSHLASIRILLKEIKYKRHLVIPSFNRPIHEGYDHGSGQ